MVSLEERRAAFRSLSLYPSEARRPYVERGLRTRDPEIRRVCERLDRESPPVEREGDASCPRPAPKSPLAIGRPSSA
ncbi:MAG: hypothetical protein DMF77_10670 [Acidobacteria bacterium]|nr:MAG: hypothetical protein DMF77_10670 [Acidobacteriota bacterium]